MAVKMSDFTNTLFGADLKEKVKNKLLFDAAAAKYKATEEKRQQSREQGRKKEEWRQYKSKYKVDKATAISTLADIIVKQWQDQTTQVGNLRDNGATAEEIQETEKALAKLAELNNQKMLDNFRKVAIEYAAKMKEYTNGDLDVESEVQYVKTQAEDKFAKTKSSIFTELKQQFTVESKKLKSQFDTDKINQEIANIPIKIEEKVEGIKTMLDTMLGKAISPLTDPTSIDFDIQELIGKLDAVLNPALGAINPLLAVVPKIPILGDLMAVMGILSSNSSPSKASKAEIKKFVKEQLASMKPSIPSGVKSTIDDIISDIMIVLMQLPMILINLIFAMIDVIYSKLKIITSVIPLGGMFPLTLIDAAISAWPLLQKLIFQLPSIITNAIKGVIQDKLAEAAMLAFPKPNIDANTLKSMIPEIKSETPSPIIAAKKPETYESVTDEFYAEVSAYGYTKSQINNILKNYKTIYDGSSTSLTRYVDNGKEQKLGSNANTMIGIVSKQLSANEMQDGFDTETNITRIVPTISHYRQQLNEFKSAGEKLDVHLSAGIYYDKLYKTDSVLGGMYSAYKEQLPVGDQVILRQLIEPSWIRRNAIERDAKHKAAAAEKQQE